MAIWSPHPNKYQSQMPCSSILDTGAVALRGHKVDKAACLSRESLEVAEAQKTGGTADECVPWNSGVTY